MDTLNKFLVGGSGDKIIVRILPSWPLSKEEALTLAAWLVAMSTLDPEKDFQPILNAVMRT